MSDQTVEVRRSSPDRLGYAASPSSVRRRVVELAERYALVGFLAVLVVLFAALPATADTFLTVANVRNLLANEAVLAIAALAAMVPLVAGRFDVSVGAVLGMASVAAAKLIGAGVPVVLSILIAVGLGAVVGVVNGAIITFARVNSFIITLAVATFITGLVSLVTNDQIITDVPTSLSHFGSGNTLGIPSPMWVLVAIAVVIALVLRFTVFGRRLLLIGSNPGAAELVGIRVRRSVWASFVIAGALAGAAGTLQLARTGAANPQVGPDYTLPALAAAFLGATTIRPGQFNVLGTIVGVFFVAVMVNGLTLAGAADWVDPVFNGVALAIAVTVSGLLARHRGAMTKDM